MNSNTVVAHGKNKEKEIVVQVQFQSDGTNEHCTKRAMYEIGRKERVYGVKVDTILVRKGTKRIATVTYTDTLIEYWV